MSDILAALLLLLVPLKHSKADRRMAKDTFALIQDMVLAQARLSELGVLTAPVLPLW